MSDLTTKICATLAGRTTGLIVAEIREATNAPGGNLLSATLFNLVKKGVLIKHKGETRQTSRYSLNPNHVTDGAKPTRKKSAKKKSRRALPSAARRKKLARAARKQTSPRKPVNGNGFLPAITAERELVLIGHGPAPVVFDATQTLAIATLVLSQFVAD